MMDTVQAPWPTQPFVFLTSPGEGVLFDPQGKFHGWMMRQHADGAWITVRKLEAVDPEDNPMIRMLKGANS
jgi:hypothetical protein